MVRKNTLVTVFFMLLALNVFSQEKSKKQIKEEQKLALQKQIDSLINSKSFVFMAESALPQGRKTVFLNSSEYQVIYKPDNINSHLPYYGRAYTGVGYGGEDGLSFEAKPDEISITKRKKDYMIIASVKANNDSFKFNLTVSFSGSASLMVTCVNRSSISFNGKISELNTQK